MLPARQKCRGGSHGVASRIPTIECGLRRLFGLGVRLGWAADAPGVTDTEIKIGQTMPYSGPVSAYGIIGRTEAAYFQMINEQGGVNGRKLNLISLDDAYSPPKTVEQIRRLVGAGAGRLHIQQPWYAIEFGDPAISQRL